ncbi:uncharacterized protein LOC135081107 [Ostrinia nubilalis]|uniref:uncharacterized protein LOC135081107 n=1 Tax=Ostrinia nubilalis TaxID=29057 RepID=UPI00308253AF
MRFEVFYLVLFVGLCYGGGDKKDAKIDDDKGRGYYTRNGPYYDERDDIECVDTDRIDGNQGNLGNLGNLGNQGNLGNLGNQGNLGDLGNQGNLGDLGNQGNLGDLGNQGNLGNIGDQANLGDLGNQGNLGNLGNQGNLGNLGNLGNQGNLSNIGNQVNKNCEIYYPCDFEDDIDCIRHYFASSGQCKETHNYARKPVYRDRLVVYLPGFNLTLIVTKTRIKYIGDRINRFYINKKTDNLIMSVDFENINIDSRYTTFIYQRRGQEPIKRADFTNATFSATLTAVVPLKKGIDFKQSRVTAYISDPITVPAIGPRVLGSTQPVVTQVNTAFLANLPQLFLEIFLTEAPSLYFGYLQKYICDFGIPISS